LGHWGMHCWHPFGTAWSHDGKQRLKSSDSFKPCHRYKGFFKVQALYLSKSLSHQSCLVPCHHAILILVVAEDPLGTNDIGIGSLHQYPYLISFKVVELFLHGHNPIRVSKCLLYLERFQRGNKRVILTKKLLNVNELLPPLEYS
jgi:hypothetical protein